MINSEAKTLFQNIVTNKMFEMDRILEGVQQASFRKMASQGLTQSGNEMHLVTQNATNSLKTRAQFILRQLLHCLAVGHVQLDTETVTEAFMAPTGRDTDAGEQRGSPAFPISGFLLNWLRAGKASASSTVCPRGPQID
jgi:hypothetical protein